MEGVYDNASVFMHWNIKAKSYLKVNFLNQVEALCQKATFLNFVIMHIRNKKMKILYFNEKKNSGKDLKIEARFLEGK